MTTAANILRDIADLIDDHQLPPPTSIMFDGQPRVHVDVKDLGWYLTALEIPGPEWHGDSDAGMMFAVWPRGTFDGEPFRLVCISTANVQVSS